MMVSKFLIPPPDVTLRTRWYVSTRWVVLAIIAMPSVAALLISDGFTSTVQRYIILALVAVASNGIFFALTRFRGSESYFKHVARTIIVVDVLMVSVMIFTNGGIESRSVTLYVLPILVTAIIFGRGPVYVTTLVCIMFYNSILIMDYAGTIHTTGSYNPELRQVQSYVVNSIVFFSAILLIIGTMVDFMMRILVEQERYARESLEGMQLAQSIAKIGSWEWDVLNDTVQWSSQIGTIYDISPSKEYMQHQVLLDIVYDEDRVLAEAAITQALRRPKHFAYEHRIQNHDRSFRFIHVEGESVADRSGKIAKIYGTVQDVTDAKILDEAKTDFVSIASHQLRTPATGVKQYLSMLRDGFAGDLSDDQQKLVQTAYESNERQLDIIDDLLHVAQVDSGKIRLKIIQTDIVELLNDIVNEQYQQFRSKNQTITVSSRYKRLRCPADSRRLRMAIENIVANTHKYTLPGKNVKISVRKLPKHVAISIADQGIGIAEQDLSRLFQKFSRIDVPSMAPVSGNGLGLYWAARIVSLHGGSIEVKSKVGRGTTFTILLPHKPAQKRALG